jgi:hypothetical protein
MKILLLRYYYVLLSLLIYKVIKMHLCIITIMHYQHLTSGKQFLCCLLMEIHDTDIPHLVEKQTSNACAYSTF